MYLQIHTLAGLPFYAPDVFFARWKGQAQFQGYEGSLIGAGKAVFEVFLASVLLRVVSARCSSILRVIVGLIFVAGSSALSVGGPLVFALVKPLFLACGSVS